MRIIKYIAGAAIIAALIMGAMSIMKANERHAAEAKAQEIAAEKAAADKAATAKMNNLAQKLSTITGSTPISTSVAVIDLDTGKSAYAGIDVVFRAASTTKVLSVAAYMHAVEQGEASLQTLISGTKAQTLLERMLRESDNNAWAAIDEYLGDNTIASYAQSIGITSYGSAKNTITASDMALLFQKLYQNELMSKANTKLILSFMQDTNNEDLIPGGLPEGTSVYHKFGLYEGELHDAAIVSYKGHTFVLVIFTNNENDTTTDYRARMELIHEFTSTTVQTMSADSRTGTNS